MSDVPEDLDLSQLGKDDTEVAAATALPPSQPVTAAPSVVMQSPEVPYPVAAPLKPGDPVPTQNHYPWTPLPLAPVEGAPIPKIALPPMPAATPPPKPVVVVTETAPKPTPAAAPIAPKPAAASAAIQVEAPPTDAQKPIMPPEVPHVDIKHIYSFSTREVWQALRPSKIFGLFLIGSITVVTLLALFLWQNSGISLYEVPFIKDTLGLE